MAQKVITCIICPVGCDITVTGENDTIASMKGHQCKRGEGYARSEFIHPVRILTSIVRVEGAEVPLVPVRSKDSIPKGLLFQCMEEIQKVVISAPVRRYDVIIPDILGTGVDIVATGEARN